MQSGIVATFMSLAVLAAFALAVGGIRLLLRREDRKRGLLMLLAAAVTLINVLIWVVPGPGPG